jgi:hypothetical protein
LEIEGQLVEGACDVLGLEPGKCFKVGLKCRHGLDGGVPGVVWTDRCSFEEGGVGWRRGMDETVVELEGVEGEDGEDDEEEEGEHGHTGLDDRRSRPGLDWLANWSGPALIGSPDGHSSVETLVPWI